MFLTDPFFWEVVISGLLAGVMYSLVALGFVLIFKASGIFNFAQGIMALFAALTLVGLLTGQVPFAHVIDAIFGLGAHHLYDPPTTIRASTTITPKVSAMQSAMNQNGASPLSVVDGS